MRACMQFRTQDVLEHGDAVLAKYRVLMAAAQNGWLDETRVMLEVLTSIKRAGADIILTYHAADAARALNG